MKAKINSAIIFLTLGTILSLCLISCNNDEKEILKDEITSITADIITTEEKIRNLETEQQNLSLKLVQQQEIYQSIKDSAEYYIKDSPMASAYIYNFDKQPADILMQYAAAANDDERGKLLLEHIILLLYYDNEESKRSVELLRERLDRLDYQSRLCASETSVLQQNVNQNKDESVAAQQHLDKQVQLKADKQIELKNMSFFGI